MKKYVFSICSIVFIGVAALSFKSKKTSLLIVRTSFSPLRMTSLISTWAYGCKWVKTPNFDRIARDDLLLKMPIYRIPNVRLHALVSLPHTTAGNWKRLANIGLIFLQNLLHLPKFLLRMAMKLALPEKELDPL